MSQFNMFKDSLHKKYAADFRQANSNNLVIVFSPTSRFSLYQVKISHNVLYLADTGLFYYLYNPARQVKLLADFIEQSGFEKIIFIGSSKGGTGALLWSSIYSKSAPMPRPSVCLSFSPQTKLYPKSSIIDFPSYSSAFSRATTSPNHMTCLKKYGDIRHFVEESLAETDVYYSELNSIDRHEAIHLSGTGVRLHKVPIPFHGAITPFLYRDTDFHERERIAKKIFSNRERDADLARSVVGDFQSLLANLEEIETPYIVDLLDEHFDKISF